VALKFETDGGIGTRATLGLVVLQADETIESEANRILPSESIALYHSRIPMPPTVNPTTLAAMEAEIPSSVSVFPDIPFDVIGYGCTSGATIIGAERVAAAVRSVHPEADVTDPVAAVIEVCRAHDIRRLGFVTPYVAEVSAAIRSRLESAEISVAGFGSFEQDDDRIVARISPCSIMQAIERVNAAAECDGVFVSCTNLRVADIAEETEAKIGKPVFSSNLALFWHMLRVARISTDRPGYGKLFSGLD